MKKADDDERTETFDSSVDGFFMRQISDAADSFEWADYEITVTCRARRLNRGFQVKRIAVTKKKVPDPT